ncbi:melanotransferrin-like [Acropora muricata]|uniref:melanotransferrin-like n=1 Tax=Acropora muricata TaxID=159855 RepID=UPI0034E4CD2F
MAKILFALLTLIVMQFSCSAATSFRWCITAAEKMKCSDFIKYVKMTAQEANISITASCVGGTSYDDCVTKISKGQADLVTLDGGSVFEAGKSKNLVPIVSEKYGKYGVKYYAVAVVKKSNQGLNLNSLKGRKSCHTAARRTAGWRVPIGYMLRNGIMPAVACGNDKNDFLSVAEFFKESCVPGVEKYIMEPRLISKLCALCQGTNNAQCSTSPSMNKYASYHGSFKCMAENGGDVAFVKHTTVEEVVGLGGYGKASDYQYLCKDNSRKEIGQHEQCHLGFNPAHAVVTRKGNADIDSIITILEKMSEKYGSNQTNTTQFQLFNSQKYSMSSGNLMFKDSATELVSIPMEKRSYVKFLGEDYVKDSEALTSCSTMEQSTKGTTEPTTSSVGGAPFVSFLLVSLSALLPMISN